MATNSVPRISLFLTNIHLLDLDRREDWPNITPETFTRKNTLENEKIRVHCVEWSLYRLFQIWDPKETKNKLQPFFPAVIPLQSSNLRAALFRCLNDLKKNDVLGKEVILRKTMLDDCKCDKIQNLLIVFSTLVLRKMLAEGQGGRGSIVGRLAVAPKITVNEHASMLPLAIAHRSSLTALLRRKKDLRLRYMNFGNLLSSKEQDMDRQFESIVHTQDFLDANPIPDHTASRISKLFEQHWYGDAELVQMITQGDQSREEETMLDMSFQSAWSKISEGDMDGLVNTTMSGQAGLLENLEKRIAEQEARLNQWKEFKESIKTDAKPSATRNVLSPALARVKSAQPDFQRQKDLVFSPRKSPRKSERDLDYGECLESESPLAHKPIISIKSSNNIVDTAVPIKLNFNHPKTRRADHRAPEIREKQDLAATSSRIHPERDDERPQSPGILNEDLHDDSFSQEDDANEDFDAPITPRTGKRNSIDLGDKRNSLGEINHQDLDTMETNNLPDDSDEEDSLAKEMESLTPNTAPTPTKPKLSLVERTRQSILSSSSPMKNQETKASIDPAQPIPLSAITESPSPQHTHPSNPPRTLLDRTRQSMSLAPTKSHKTSRRSTDATTNHRRRTSKLYPTNQFETPEKPQTQSSNKTPPEELFSPGAGYDSVFKSRPKVGFSPVASPVLGSEESGVDRGEDRWGKGEGMDVEESPLARRIGG
ncbi:hypothetical protein ACLMJK_005160 [Lecanora helva]